MEEDEDDIYAPEENVSLDPLPNTNAAPTVSAPPTAPAVAPPPKKDEEDTDVEEDDSEEEEDEDDDSVRHQALSVVTIVF